MTYLRLTRLVSSAAAPVVLCTSIALADEPRKGTEPPVLREPAELMRVADAFDDDNPFDLWLSLGFQQSWKQGNILRESASPLNQFSSGGYTAGNMNVARYNESTSRLNTRADIGLYKDISLVARMPIILAHDRKLSDLDGSAATQSSSLLGAEGEQLFRLPFQSPTRSGIEYLALGLNVGIMNQYRDPTKPTWIVGVEGRFNVSEPMRACGSSNEGLNQPGPQQRCAYPSDINRNGTSDLEHEGSFSGGRSPGVSRGTTGLQAHTYFSKRIKYIEPYTGFEALFEFPIGSSDFGLTDLQGSLVNHPPVQGSLIMGMEWIPWEIRDQFQRIAVDFRFRGTYRSEGRDYSPLFDALGSSDARYSLRQPNFADFQQGPGGTSVANEASQRVYFTGITGVQAHGIYTFSTQFTFQAGEYVRFNVGGAFTMVQGHLITFDQPCNPNFTGDINRTGPCRRETSQGTVATGIPNPNYRPAINAPGRRFRVDDMTGLDAWVNAIVMF